MEKQYPDDHFKLWVIRGNAYDLNNWAKHHPGGQAVLDQVKGTDCTALFESYHTFVGTRFEKGPGNGKNSTDMNKLLNRFYVRKATEREVDESAEWDWSNTPKTHRIKHRVREYFDQNHIHPKAPNYILAFYVIYFVTLVISFYVWLTTGNLFAALVFGCAIWYSSGDSLHSGTHYAIFNSPTLNLAVAYTLGVFHHIPLVWIRQHVIGHHVFPNIAGKDPDLYHFEVFSFFTKRIFGWRLTENSTFRKGFTNWIYGLWLLMFITGIGPALIESIEYINVGSLLAPWVVPHKTKVSRLKKTIAFMYWLFLFSVVAYVSYKFSFLQAIAPFAIHGSLYYTFSQVSHANQESHVPGDRGMGPVIFARRRRRQNASDFKPRKTEWFEHQFHTSHGDYSVSSTFWSIASIGLNLQSVHHCFPNVHWSHYPAIYPILCDEFNVEPSTKNLWLSFKEHLEFVNFMNYTSDSYKKMCCPYNNLLSDTLEDKNQTLDN